MNSAGRARVNAVLDTAPADWDRVPRVNLTGPMLISRACPPRTIERAGGSIVNTSSVATVRGLGTAAYGASTAGLDALTIDLAVSYGAAGVRVNAVAPGQVSTPLARRLGIDEPGRELHRLTTPLATEGTVWDVAWAVLFLASDEARWITGTTLVVDESLSATVPRTMLRQMVGDRETRTGMLFEAATPDLAQGRPRV